MNKQIRFIVALVVGLTMLSLPILASAEVIVDVLQVRLTAKGAGATVSIEITCNPAFGPDNQLGISMLLAQRAGNIVHQGSVNSENIVNCDGDPKGFDFIAVGGFGRPFKHGPAVLRIEARVFDPDSFMFEDGEFAQEIH